MAQLGVSTWSLHNALGLTYPGLDPAAVRPPRPAYGPGTLDLLELPARLADLGITDLDLCHFHLPSTEPAYLTQLRSRLEDAGVRLLTLLIDAGDITAADEQAREADRTCIAAWIDVAGEAGARRVRVIAGDAAPTPDAVKLSVQGLAGLAERARARGVEVITENWHPLALDTPSLLAILDELDGQVGLCADFGNARGPRRFETLAAILPRAASVHAKADYSAAGTMAEGDFRRCLDLARDAGFAGTYVLIFEGPGDELSGVGQMADVVQAYL